MSSQGPFAGKVAIVTGGTQGLGEAIARLLAARGAAGIVVTGRNAERGAAGAGRAGGDRRTGAVRAGRAGRARSGPARGGRDRCQRSAGSTAWSMRPASPTAADPRHLARAVRPHVRGQRARTLLPDPGRRPDHAPRRRRRHDRQHPLDLEPMAASISSPPTRRRRVRWAMLTRNVAYALMRDGIRVNGLNIGWMNTPGEHTIQKVAHDAPADWLDKAGAGLPLGRLLGPSRGGARDGLPAFGREHADERRAGRLRPVGAGCWRPAAADGEARRLSRSTEGGRLRRRHDAARSAHGRAGLARSRRAAPARLAAGQEHQGRCRRDRGRHQRCPGRGCLAAGGQERRRARSAWAGARLDRR